MASFPNGVRSHVSVAQKDLHPVNNDGISLFPPEDLASPSYSVFSCSDFSSHHWRITEITCIYCKFCFHLPPGILTLLIFYYCSTLFYFLKSFFSLTFFLPLQYHLKQGCWNLIEKPIREKIGLNKSINIFLQLKDSQGKQKLQIQLLNILKVSCNGRFKKKS